MDGAFVFTNIYICKMKAVITFSKSAAVHVYFMSMQVHRLTPMESDEDRRVDERRQRRESDNRRDTIDKREKRPGVLHMMN